MAKGADRVWSTAGDACETIATMAFSKLRICEVVHGISKARHGWVPRYVGELRRVCRLLSAARCAGSR